MNGATDEAVQNAISTFNGREHTLEFVMTHNDVTFINDAKSTNPWSLLHAIGAFPGRSVVLIAGGDDIKQTDFTAVAAGNLQPLTAAVLFGNSATALADAFSRHLPETSITITGDFFEAIEAATRRAEPNDVVVYSPGVYSPIAEPDHLARGTLFKELVQAL